jgi:hypothetical protein
MSSNFVKIGALLTGRGRPLTCESCGKEFSCGMSLRGCWCSEVQLSDDSRAELKKQFRDCLCRDCLVKLSASSPAAMHHSDVDNLG